MRYTDAVSHREIQTIDTTDPTRTALVAMGRAAKDAAETWTMREWAGRLAAQAGPRDFVGQLRALYDGVLARWRYVQEAGEWVPGSARSVLGNVLGLAYQGAADPTRATVVGRPVSASTRGWGDCDDVSTLIAAGVRSLGMTPYFRVTMGPTGGHVHVLAKTPRGETVSLDPVGHPAHPFGWMLPAQNAQIYDLTASPAGLGCLPCLAGTPAPRARAQHGRTQLVRVGNAARTLAVPRYYCEHRPGRQVPSVIAIRSGQMSRYGAEHGLQGVDEHDQLWQLDAENRVFVPLGAWSDVRRRWRKRAKFVTSRAEKVGDVARGALAKVYGSNAVMGIVSGILQPFGVPASATKAVMAAGADIIKTTGILKFVREMKRDPKFVLRLLAKAGKQGLIRSGALPPQAVAMMSGIDDRVAVIRRNGQMIALQPLGIIVELAAVPEWLTAAKTPDFSAENANARQAAAMQPKTYKNESQQPGQSLRDWLANVAYWATYPSAPRKITTQRSWAKAWMRIARIVEAELLNRPTTTTTPTTKPTTTPTTKPPVFVAFVVNPNEAAIARDVVRERPRVHVHRGVSHAQGPRKSTSDWLTDVAYYRAYPEGPGNIEAKDRGYADAWKRLALDVKAALKASTTPSTTPTTTPTTTPNTTPTTTPKFVRNPDEILITSATVDARPNAYTHRGRAFTRGAKPIRTWLANVAYWRAYPAGPSVIGQDKNHGAAWNRIMSEVQRLMPSTPNLPIDTRAEDCAASGGTWEPQTKFCRPPGGVTLPTDTRAADCAASGGTWDPAAGLCRKTEVVLPDVDEGKKSGYALPLAIAGAAVVAAMMLGKGSKRR